MLHACGITEFLLPATQAASARIKEKPEDFIVVEIDPAGHRTDAENYEFFQTPERTEHRVPPTNWTAEDISGDFVVNDMTDALADDLQDALQKIFLSKADAIDADLSDDTTEYDMGVFNTRTKRERLHRLLKRFFPHLRSDTRRLETDDGYDYHVYATYDRDYLFVARLIGEAAADTINAWGSRTADDSDSIRSGHPKGPRGASVTALFSPDVSKSTRRLFHETIARRYPFVTCRVTSGALTLRHSPRPCPKRPRGDGFTHLLVRKRNVDALELRELLAEACGVAETSVCAAGLKDKCAVTFQRCSVPGDGRAPLRPLRIGERADGFAEILRAAGPFAAPVAIGELRGNAFRVRLAAVRGTTPEALRRRAARVFSGGFLNYFGPQRFSENARTINEHIGVHALAGRWAAAVRCALRGVAGLYEALPLRMDPRLAPPAARDAQCVLRGLRRATRHTAASGEKEEKGEKEEEEEKATREDVTGETPRWQRICREALEAVPFAIRVLWMHAAQSLVFNLTLSRLRAAGAEVDGLALPIIGHSVDVPPVVRGALDETLAELQLTQTEAMGQKKVMGVPLPGAVRQAVVRPLECSVDVEENGEGEVNDEFAATLAFQLPSSSYATILLREVLGSNQWW